MSPALLLLSEAGASATLVMPTMREWFERDFQVITPDTTSALPY